MSGFTDVDIKNMETLLADETSRDSAKVMLMVQFEVHLESIAESLAKLANPVAEESVGVICDHDGVWIPAKGASGAYTAETCGLCGFVRNLL